MATEGAVSALTKETTAWNAKVMGSQEKLSMIMCYQSPYGQVPQALPKFIGNNSSKNDQGRWARDEMAIGQKKQSSGDGKQGSKFRQQ